MPYKMRTYAVSTLCRYFPIEQFHFVDGNNLIDKPWVEFRRLENFLGLEHEITEDRFFFNKTKGFYCMQVRISLVCKYLECQCISIFECNF